MNYVLWKREVESSFENSYYVLHVLSWGKLILNL